MRFILCCVWVLAASVAIADTVNLSNSGKVVGKIVELRMVIGPLDKVFARDQIVSLKCRGGRCEVVATDKTKYDGKLESVSIRCVAGILNFGAKSVESIELSDDDEPMRAEPPRKTEPPDVPGPEPRGKPAEPTPPDDQTPVTLPIETEKPAGKKPPAEQKARLAALFKAASTLRDEYLKKVDEQTDAQYKEIREKYQARWDKACQDVKEKEKEYAARAAKPDGVGPRVDSGGLGIGMTRTTTVTSSGPAATALQELMAAEAAKSRLARTIKDAQEAVRDNAHIRKERVRAYYYAIYRCLITGKEISEDGMRKVFEKAVKEGG